MALPEFARQGVDAPLPTRAEHDDRAPPRINGVRLLRQALLAPMMTMTFPVMLLFMIDPPLPAMLRDSS